LIRHSQTSVSRSGAGQIHGQQVCRGVRNAWSNLSEDTVCCLPWFHTEPCHWCPTTHSAGSRHGAGNRDWRPGAVSAGRFEASRRSAWSCIVIPLLQQAARLLFAAIHRLTCLRDAASGRRILLFFEKAGFTHSGQEMDMPRQFQTPRHSL